MFTALCGARDEKICADWRLSKTLNAFFCLVSCFLVFYFLWQMLTREHLQLLWGSTLLLVLAGSAWVLVLTFARSRGFIFGAMLFPFWGLSQDLRRLAPLPQACDPSGATANGLSPCQNTMRSLGVFLLVLRIKQTPLFHVSSLQPPPYLLLCWFWPWNAF